MVKAVAWRTVGRATAPVELEDCIGMGVVGLIGAADSFDESKGVKFAAYAQTRVRGAILDGLRALDLLSRHMRAKAGRLKRAYLEAGKGRHEAPAAAEVARLLNVGVEELHAMAGECSVSVAGGDSLDLVADRSARDPEAVAMHNELKERLAEELEKLDERERTLLALRYNEELSFDEIAEVLGLTGSRLCQIHSGLMKRLRRRLERGGCRASIANARLLDSLGGEVNGVR